MHNTCSVIRNCKPFPRDRCRLAVIPNLYDSNLRFCCLDSWSSQNCHRLSSHCSTDAVRLIIYWNIMWKPSDQTGRGQPTAAFTLRDAGFPEAEKKPICKHLLLCRGELSTTCKCTKLSPLRMLTSHLDTSKNKAIYKHALTSWVLSAPWTPVLICSTCVWSHGHACSVFNILTIYVFNLFRASCFAYLSWL